MKKSSWKITFIDQLRTGNFWKKLFKDDFYKELFLCRSDAADICKEAQMCVYEDIIDELKGKVDDSIISELESKLEKHKNNNISSLGMGIKL